MKLVAQPDFEQAYIDGKISLNLVTPEEGKRSGSKAPLPVTEDVIGVEDNQPISDDYSDPVPRLEMLEAANRRPVCVTRDSKVREATTKMLMNDFSQLPVSQNDRDVDGLISEAIPTIDMLHG